MQAAQKQEDLMPFFMGKQTTLTLPSGRVVTIREINGDDEEILSNQELAMKGDNIPKFLQGIITEELGKTTLPLVADIEKWPVKDKYYLLFAQRLLNHGDKLEITHTCIAPGCGHEENYEEDLTIFQTNFKDFFDGKITLDNLTKLQCKPYPVNDPEIIMTLSSQKKIKFSILTGELEMKSLDNNEISTKNAPLLVRELKIFNKEKWIELKHLGVLSARETAEIRAAVQKYDSPFLPIITLECPKCKTPNYLNLFAIPVFFYPETRM